MSNLKPKFPYQSILIGEEIIVRALNQQERFANSNQYGMTWTQQDVLDRSQIQLQADTMRQEFSIPGQYQTCIPEPPCPWTKQADELTPAMIMPILTANDGAYTYSFKVAQRTDSGNTYQIGQDVAAYANDQSQLDPSVSSEFSYYAFGGGIGYDGRAIYVINKSHRGSLVSTYYYLFDLLK